MAQYTIRNPDGQIKAVIKDGKKYTIQPAQTSAMGQLAAGAVEGAGMLPQFLNVPVMPVAAAAGAYQGIKTGMQEGPTEGLKKAGQTFLDTLPIENQAPRIEQFVENVTGTDIPLETPPQNLGQSFMRGMGNVITGSLVPGGLAGVGLKAAGKAPGLASVLTQPGFMVGETLAGGLPKPLLILLPTKAADPLPKP